MIKPLFIALLSIGVCTASVVKLAWDAPTTNTDGSQITGQITYRVYYGTEVGVYSNYVEVTETSTSIIGLDSVDTCFFTITAVVYGEESQISNEVEAINFGSNL